MFTKPRYVVIIFIMTTFLKELRQNMGLSQQKLADLMEISQSRYANYEIGCRELPICLAYKLMDIANSPAYKKKIKKKVKFIQFYPREDYCKR